MLIKCRDLKLSKIKNYAIGGLSSSITSTCILPIDYLKVPRQMLMETGFKQSALMYTKNTFKSLKVFNQGFDSALYRQVLYTTVRLRFYGLLSDIEKCNTGIDSISFWHKIYYSLIAGVFGSSIGRPADITLVRAHTEAIKPLERRWNYKGVSDAFMRKYKAEELAYCKKGSAPTILRASIMNAGMLVPYHTVKEMLDQKHGQALSNKLGASFVASVIACFVALPCDHFKTKYQNMVPDHEGKLPFSSFNDCVKKSIAREGMKGLYIGFPMFVMRCAPQLVVTLLTQEFLHSQLA